MGMGKVLVAYATKHHSTAEIAEAIASELRADGLETDVAEVSAATADGYDAIVLGSAVYTGRWRKEAVSFLKLHRDQLARVPFWIFSSGPLPHTVDEDSADNSRWLEPQKVLDLARALGMRGHTVIGGRVPIDPHGWIEKSMLKNTPEGLRDARDWDQIRQWAAGIATELTSTRR